ncbi:site-specific integrase [Pedobacter helvus]|uniref:Tyrosine-type recombinase/integrase n=1 Tax=Pedobacter helvus TaxID=2563444 RepID=A0ABW9JJM5_9SPHI|nr:site-specific integrase [Pedobacter ureilyticus]
MQQLRKVYTFITTVFKKEDLLLSDIRPSFALNFLNYMTKEVSETLAEPTAMKQIKKIKQILYYAIDKEWLLQSPIQRFKCKGDDTEVEPLEVPDVIKIYRKKGLVKRLEEVRDAFIFQCFTGFAYQDIYHLTPEHIVEVGLNRERWLIKKRGKTKVSEMVPILPIVEELIAKYKEHPKCVVKNRLMPIDSNGRYNGYLKEIQNICGIVREDIIFDTHLARHTFADMMLNSGVPLEDVSKMLGHKSIRTTQRYCRVKKHRISKNMQVVKYSLFTKSGKLRKTLVA